MGEKGNVSELAAGAAAPLLAGAEQSLIERVTTTTTATVLGVGEDLASTIREKAVGAVADASVAAARDRWNRDHEDPDATAAGQGDDSPGTPPTTPAPPA
ncbi:MAG: hypothetical protein WKF57_11125 [Nakamurella sp.]